MTREEIRLAIRLRIQMSRTADPEACKVAAECVLRDIEELSGMELPRPIYDWDPQIRGAIRVAWPVPLPDEIPLITEQTG